MSFLMIPNEVTNQGAIIWLGIANENINLGSLTLLCNGTNIPFGQWMQYPTQNNNIIYQYLPIPNLQPRTDYSLEFFLDGVSKTTASLRTLPDDLPTVNETPFTVLLASCFCSSRSESTMLGSTYLNLQRQQKTDVKILCGDQVYLDDPTLHFSFHTHSTAELEDKLLSNYLRTWGQTGEFTGYQQFLQNGANFFSSDDHEFWNNAPSWATAIRDTWTSQGRNAWMGIAGTLLRIFQSDKAITRFNVGSLSFFISDTRVNRDADKQNFMSPSDLNDLKQWVTNLQGVGVLVIGQPLFSDKSGFFGSLTDFSLADYQQYKDLVRIISQTNHSILLLTGDVHYGRISRCQLKPDIFLYEIISSPTALVNPLVGGKWHKAPDTFPSFGIPGVAQQAVENNFNYQLTKNHFLTLDFYKDGARTKVVVNAIEITGGGQTPQPMKIDEFNLS